MQTTIRVWCKCACKSNHVITLTFFLYVRNEEYKSTLDSKYPTLLTKHIPSKSSPTLKDELLTDTGHFKLFITGFYDLLRQFCREICHTGQLLTRLMRLETFSYCSCLQFL